MLRHVKCVGVWDVGKAFLASFSLREQWSVVVYCACHAGYKLNLQLLVTGMFFNQYQTFFQFQSDESDFLKEYFPLKMNISMYVSARKLPSWAINSP